MVTPAQRKIYEFIQDYIAQQGYSPSLVDIAVGVGISPKSTSLVSRSLHALEKAGLLKLDKKGHRNIQLANGGGFSLSFAGSFTEGRPLELAESEQKIDLSEMLRGQNHFVYRAKGNNLLDEGIREGDLMICQRPDHAKENDLVLALIDQKTAVLRRVSFQIKDRITLIPTTPNLKPIAYLPNRIQIQGVYKGLLRLNGKVN